MVANYRCNEIKEEAMALVKSRVEELQNQSDLSIVSDFGDRCNSVVREATEYYAEKAKQYNKEVFSKVREELCETILSSLYQCFDS